jgi:hypothetical protein
MKDLTNWLARFMNGGNALTDYYVYHSITLSIMFHEVVVEVVFEGELEAWVGIDLVIGCF